MTATKAVLPAMREAGAGTLLFTTAAGCLAPLPMVGNVNAAAALRNWVVNLHKELDGTGIQAAHVAIDVALGGVPIDPTLKAATPEAVSPFYWDLHTTKRDQPEIVYRG
jgi:hypothetical protein